MANDWRETVEAVLELQKDPDLDTSPGPALQWYPAQWSGDPAVALMSMEARGIHHHLLMTAWKGFALEGDAVPCSVPEDPEVLRALCQHPAGWDAALPHVLRAWKAHAGRLWNLGLCRSYLRQMEKRRCARTAAALRWESKRTADASDVDANASPADADASDPVCTSSSSSCFLLQALPEERREPTALVGDPDGSTDHTEEMQEAAAENGNLAELRWRIDRVWDAHLRMRELYWQDVEFSDRPPGSPPTLTKERRKLIGEALKRHDSHLIGPLLREKWEAESKVRGAAIGIFMDPWCTARAAGNVLSEGGKRYLEPERPFKIMKGVDNTERFAEVYYERKQRKERRQNGPT